MSRHLSTAHGMPISKAEDEDRLAQLGYSQELKRDWGLMHNFGASFSIIVCFHAVIGNLKTRLLMFARALSLVLPRMTRTLTHRFNVYILTQCSLFGYGLNSGGPAVMSWSWLVVTFFSETPLQGRLNTSCQMS